MMTENIRANFHEVLGAPPVEEIERLILVKYSYYVSKLLGDFPFGLLTSTQRDKLIILGDDAPSLEDFAYTDEGISSLHKCGIFSKNQYLDCYSVYRKHFEQLNHSVSFDEDSCLNKFEYVILATHRTTINAYRNMDWIDWLPLAKKRESLHYGRITIFSLYLHYREKHLKDDKISSSQERQCIMNFAQKYAPTYVKSEMTHPGPKGPIFNALTMFMKYRESENQETVDVEEFKLYLILRCIKLTLYKIRTVPWQIAAVFNSADMAAYYNVLDEVEQ